MIQVVLVILVISAAIFYLGRLVYKRFISKESACDGCAIGKSIEKADNDNQSSSTP